MKVKYRLELSDEEHQLVMHSLIRLRNRVIADGIDSIDVDRLLLKVMKLKKKKLLLLRRV